MADQYGAVNDLSVITDLLFRKYCDAEEFGLSPVDIQTLYSSVRHDGLSLKQIKAALEFICGCDSCDKEDLIDVLKECDRRYFLLQDLKWEFSLLDTGIKGSVSQEKALFLLRLVHGDTYSKERWKTLLESREMKHSDLSFEEIEIDLCNIFTPYDNKTLEKLWNEREKTEINRQRQLRIEAEKKEKEEREKMEEDAERERLRQENERKKVEEQKKQQEIEKNKKKEQEDRDAALLRAQEVEEQRNQEAEEQKRLEEERLREEEEQRRIAEEAKRLQEEEEEQRKKAALANWKKEQLLEQQQQELQKMNEMQAAKAKLESEQALAAEIDADDAAEAEQRAKEEAERHALLAKDAKDEESRRLAQEAERKALQEAKENKIKKLKANLKAAAKSKKVPRIKEAISEAKESKLEGLQDDIHHAEEVLDLVACGQKLQDAMLQRNLPDLEKAIDVIKKKNYVQEYPLELIEGEKLANKLRRLARLRKEIAELNQSTISEIRSYQKPPPAVHQVMIAVYIILGHKEKELKVWKTMQALLGKTGKEGLKRLVTQLEPSQIDLQLAEYADKNYLAHHDLDTIRDVSAGAATFFVWCSTMVEEARAYEADSARRKEVEAQRKQEEEEEKRRAEEKKKMQKEKNKSSGGEASGTGKSGRKPSSSQEDPNRKKSQEKTTALNRGRTGKLSTTDKKSQK